MTSTQHTPAASAAPVRVAESLHLWLEFYLLALYKWGPVGFTPLAEEFACGLLLALVVHQLWTFVPGLATACHWLGSTLERTHTRGCNLIERVWHWGLRYVDGVKPLAWA